MFYNKNSRTIEVMVLASPELPDTLEPNRLIAIDTIQKILNKKIKILL